MGFQQKDNSGALFKNDRKDKDTDRDYNGEATIDGVAYWVSAWINESRNGVKYLGLRFNQKENNQESKPKLKVVGGDDPNDLIPF